MVDVDMVQRLLIKLLAAVLEQQGHFDVAGFFDKTANINVDASPAGSHNFPFSFDMNLRSPLIPRHCSA